MTYETWRISYQSSEQAARAAYAECEQLRAKIEQMERQEPVAWRYQDVRGNHRYRSYVAGFDMEYRALKPIPLYALPGAQTQGEEK